jgi:signal transduction histidine kinase
MTVSWLRSVRDVAVVVVALAVELLVWHGDRQLRGGGTAPMWVVPVLAVAVFSTLLRRWRRPVEVFWLQWAYALAGLVLPGYQPFAGLLVALHAVARRAPARVAWLALVACALPFGVNGYNSAAGAHSNARAVFAATAVLWIVLSAMVWGFGRLAKSTDDRAEELRTEEAARAVRAERLKLARELHDIVAGAVGGMVLQAAGTRRLVGTQDEKVRESLRVIEHSGVQAMGELRRLLTLLRAADPATAEVDRAHQVGLEDLPALVERFQAAGLTVETVADGHLGADLDPSVGLAAYRIVQESLTNTRKHAGPGAAVRIELSRGESYLTVTVRDAGGRSGDKVGMPSLSSGHGLVGLAERVALVGGLLSVGPVDGGFLVRAELPLRGPDPPARRPSAEGDRVAHADPPG